MRHRKETWAVLIVVGVIAVVLAVFALNTVRQVASLENAVGGPFSGELSGVNTSTWETYWNTQYGFSFEYPQNWKISTTGLASGQPFLAVGNPLEGMQVYTLFIYIKNNAQALSSGEYVHAMLAADRAQDAANSGTAPQVTPIYKSAFITTAGGYDAYELSDVFEFDQNSEQIYIAHGDKTLLFDFPVAEANPNLASPVNNNAIAHMIVDTLSFQ